MFYKGNKLPESMEVLLGNYKTHPGEGTCSRSLSESGAEAGLGFKTLRCVFFSVY